MLRNSLVALGLVGAILVPTGVALAQADETGTVPPAVAADADQDRIRDRIRDPEVCGTCPNLVVGETTVILEADQLQDQDQVRDQDRDGDCDLGPIRDRDQIRDQIHR